MKKIYCYKYETIIDKMLIHVVALCEDGVIVADHLCSEAAYMRRVMGIGDDWNHDPYNAHCGAGQWELEWVDDEDIDNHQGFLAALARHREWCEAEEAL